MNRPHTGPGRAKQRRTIEGGAWAAGALGLALLAGCAASGTGSAGDGSRLSLASRDANPLHGPSTNATRAAQEAARQVAPSRLRADVDRLASFGTRHVLSDANDPQRGIGAARRWILAEFEQVAAQRAAAGVGAGLPPARVYLDTHALEPGMRRIDTRVEIANVVAVLPGRLEAQGLAERIYISGHYDSRNGDEMDRTGDAPGANDDASGTAVVLESLRVLGQREHDHTLVFVAFDAEEAGLYGARAHVGVLSGLDARVRAVLNHDIVGDPSAPNGAAGSAHTVHLFSEGLPAAGSPTSSDELAGRDGAMLIERLRREGALGDSSSRQLARYVLDASAVLGGGKDAFAPTLVFRADRFLRGGDHTPFHEAGYAAVRFTEVEEDYSRQHQNVRTEGGQRYGDLPEFVDEQYLARVTGLNVATATLLASAPTAPARARIVTAQLSNDTLIRWDASPDPDVAGYEVVWRATTSPVWERRAWAGGEGGATELRVPVSKDGAFFGVRAVDRNGNPSLVSFCYSARE